MEQPSYYAILPANVRYNKALPPMARILYAEITALSNRDGFCSAPNRYFARLYEVDESTVTKWLGALRDQSHITVLITRNEAKQIIGRQIFPTETLPAKMRVPSPQKDQDPPRKNAGTPPRKNAAVNNTSINTTSNNRENARETASKIDTPISIPDTPDWKEIATAMYEHTLNGGKDDWEFLKASSGYTGDGRDIFATWAGKANAYQLRNWKDEFRKLGTWMRNEARANLKSQPRQEQETPTRRPIQPKPQRERHIFTLDDAPEEVRARLQKHGL